MNTDHYYDDNTVANTEQLFGLIRNIALNWERQPQIEQPAIKPSA
jgi:hypothetical protein